MRQLCYSVLALAVAGTIRAQLNRRGAMAITDAPVFAEMLPRQGETCDGEGYTPCPGGPAEGCCPNGVACTVYSGQLACAEICGGVTCAVGGCCNVGEECPTVANGFCTADTIAAPTIAAPTIAAPTFTPAPVPTPTFTGVAAPTVSSPPAPTIPASASQLNSELASLTAELSSAASVQASLEASISVVEITPTTVQVAVAPRISIRRPDFWLMEMAGLLGAWII